MPGPGDPAARANAIAVESLSAASTFIPVRAARRAKGAGAAPDVECRARSVLVEGYGIPLGRVLAGANRHDSPLLGATLDRLDDLGPLPEQVVRALAWRRSSRNV